MTSRLIDVTPQILNHHKTYGGSDNTNQGYTSSSRSLNYSRGGSIQKPEQETVSNIPRNIQYRDSVGLFGVENHFIKIKLQLKEPITGIYQINDYLPAEFGVETYTASDPYTWDNAGYDTPGRAYIDYEADLDDDGSCSDRPVCWNKYEPAQLGSEIIPALNSKYYKIELKNLKTGNIYIDSWLDVRLYNKFREEHPYDIMYIKQNEFFYIGFHARNTKRLPYNVACVVAEQTPGDENPAFGELKDFDNRYLSVRR